ncbi:MAG: GNAT family N-acetyltransferase [Gelidibacter sp.]
MDYHQDRFEDFSLLIFNNEQLVALLPANKVDNTVYSHQGLTYGGLLLSKTITFDDVLQSFKTILDYLNTNGITHFQLKLIPKIYHQIPSDEIDYMLFKLKANIIRRDLTCTIDSFNSLKPNSSNRKRGLKKAIKNELKVREVQDFEGFWNSVLIPNLQEKHQTSPVHTLSEISYLKSKFPHHIRQFNVFKNKEVVAGVTIFETQNVAHAQYISANNSKQELGSLDVVLHHLMTEVYKEKPYFDFGISNENQGQHINYGLMSWKESFGARSIVHDFYEIETKNVTLLNDIMV